MFFLGVQLQVMEAELPLLVVLKPLVPAVVRYTNQMVADVQNFINRPQKVVLIILINFVLEILNNVQIKIIGDQTRQIR